MRRIGWVVLFIVACSTDKSPDGPGPGSGDIPDLRKALPALTGAIAIPPVVFSGGSMAWSLEGMAATVPTIMSVHNASGKTAEALNPSAIAAGWLRAPTTYSQLHRISVSSPEAEGSIQSADFLMVSSAGSLCDKVGEGTELTVGATFAAKGVQVAVGYRRSPVTTGQRLALALKGAPDDTTIPSTSTSIQCAGVAYVQFPSDAANGEYEVRIYADAGNTVVKRSAPIVVGDADACGGAGVPALAMPWAYGLRGAEATVVFRDAPNAIGQEIALAPIGSADAASHASVAALGCAGSVELPIPGSLPVGLYELRLRDASGVRARAPIPISAPPTIVRP